MWKGESPRAVAALALLIAVVSFTLRAVQLSFPPTYYFDEVYYAFTAQTMARGDAKAWEWWNTPPEGFAYEWTHPPLSKLLITAGILAAGDRTLGWRLPGALAGAAASALMFLVGRLLFRSTRWGMVVAALFTLDLLPFVQSRIATPEAFLYCFIPLALFCALKFRASVKLSWLAATGGAFGLLLATKWSMLPVVAVLGATALLALWHAVRARRLSALAAIFGFAGFGMLLPLVVYLLSFSVFFATGHSWETFLELHRQMYWYHAHLTATHPYQSAWWQWPLILRTIYYYTNTDAATANVSNIYALGNPAIWWPGIVAVLSLLAQTIIAWKRAFTSWFLLAGYFLLWLPLALSPRVMFIYHYLPASIFLILALVALLRDLSRSTVGQRGVLVYLAVVLLIFIYFYPIAVGTYLTPASFEERMWLPSWR